MIYAFGLVKRELERDGIGIAKVMAYGDATLPLAIIVVTDGDAYSRLRRYSLGHGN